MIRALLISVAVAVVIAAPFGVSLPQNSKQSAELELSEIEKRLDSEKKALSELLAKQGRVLEKLDALNAQLRASKARLQSLSREKEITEAEVAELSEKTGELSEKLEKKRKLMGERMAARYRFGRSGTLRLWIETESISELSRKARYLETLYLRDMEVLEQYNALLEEYKAAAEGLERKRRKLLRLSQIQERQKEELASRKRTLQSMLREVSHKRETHQQVAAELERSSQRLQKLIEGLEAAGPGMVDFPRFKGALCYPAMGEITSGFGNKVHPVFLTVTRQNGIEIGARKGDPVKAVLPGVVRFASWFLGYGKLVILDHGKGYYTLYAHLDDVEAELGERLGKGDLIGTVGDTGSLSGPSLYFEIRRHKDPLDPSDWLADCVE